MKRIPYLTQREWGWYWQPTPALKRLGFSMISLGKDEEEARRRALELNAQVEQEKAKVAAGHYEPKPGTVAATIRLYQESLEYQGLRDSTKRGYDQRLVALEEWIGDAPLDDITPKLMKSWYRKVQETSPSTANANLRVAKLLWSWAVSENLADENPAKHVRMKGTKPRQALWEPWEVDCLIEAADRLGRPSMGHAIRIAFDCTQRQGDVLSLTWDQIDDGLIAFKQSKTGALCHMPLTTELSKRLAMLERPAENVVPLKPAPSPVVVSEATGIRYEGDNFRRLFAKVRKAANDAWKDQNGTEEDRFLGRQFLDLRRSGMVEAAHAGVALRDTAARSGHSINRTQAILETYVPATREMAAAAVSGVEKARAERIKNRSER